MLSPNSLRELSAYLDCHVARLLSTPESELAAKSEDRSCTLLDSLGLMKLDSQVIIFLRGH
ncbi:MAG: hypothetical protein M1839_000949 [Geoglossum umbratile]|nr:MAG: hypothetical protein M1839_000949 [Geoglossum umbratile]